ncbi:MAG: 6-carboxytetrahydropterin synthase [Pyrinomonadaceae bacterium]|nr:6-carboxytetrahydropterin synthase [Phycisphaerales bacterium]
MYELTVEAVFSAAHALVIQGALEQIHGHDWHVTAAVTGTALDADGLLVDFHAVEKALQAIVAPFKNANLNQTPPFDRVNPSAENVAAYLAQSLDERVWRLVGAGATDRPTNSAGAPRVAWVRVTEAHGCAVKWIRT